MTERRTAERHAEQGRALVFEGRRPPVDRRVYVCGPMTGYPELNHPAFHQAAAKLRHAGYAVISPAEPPIAQVPQTDWNAAVRGALRGLLACEGVAVVTPSGIRQSRGAQLEIHLARSLAMPVLYWQTWIQAADAWTARRRSIA